MNTFTFFLLTFAFAILPLSLLAWSLLSPPSGAAQSSTRGTVRCWTLPLKPVQLRARTLSSKQLFARAWHRWRGQASRLWFWLTHSIDCSWCGKRLHRRWLWLPPLKSRRVRLPRISHGMCPACFQNFTSGLFPTAPDAAVQRRETESVADSWVDDPNRNPSGELVTFLGETGPRTAVGHADSAPPHPASVPNHALRRKLLANIFTRLQRTAH